MRHPYLTAEWWRAEWDLCRIAVPALGAFLRLDVDEFDRLAVIEAEPVRQRRDRMRERWANRREHLDD
jgi:hypothetical protein